EGASGRCMLSPGFGVVLAVFLVHPVAADRHFALPGVAVAGRAAVGAFRMPVHTVRSRAVGFAFQRAPELLAGLLALHSLSPAFGPDQRRESSRDRSSCRSRSRSMGL